MAQSKKYNVLYVDDEQDNLFAFKSVFRRNFTIYTAIGGQEAIEILNNNSVDLVVSDQRMPNMSGVELCTYVKENHPTAGRIIVTGYSEKSPIEEAIKSGAVSHLIMKPWDANHLKNTMEEILT